MIRLRPGYFADTIISLQSLLSHLSLTDALGVLESKESSGVSRKRQFGSEIDPFIRLGFEVIP